MDAADFTRTLQEFGAGLADQVTAAATVAAEALRARAAAGSPVVTGELRDSWQVRPAGPGLLAVENTAPYAEYVEVGHQTHPGQHMLGTAIAEVAR